MQLDLRRFDLISIVLFSLRPVSWWRMAFWWRCRKAPGRFGTSSSSPTCCSVPRWRRRLWGESTLPFILQHQNSLLTAEPFACAALSTYYCGIILFASICMSFIFPSTSARKPPTVKQKRMTLALYKRYCRPVCSRLCKARELIEASLTKRKTSRHFASGFLKSWGEEQIHTVNKEWGWGLLFSTRRGSVCQRRNLFELTCVWCHI